MNVYLMVDIEGISGIYAREQVIPTEAKFSEGRRFMTEDINACVKGLKEAGVEAELYEIKRACHGFEVAYDSKNLIAVEVTLTTPANVAAELPYVTIIIG